VSTDVRSPGSRSTIVAGGDLIDRFSDDAGFLSNFSAHPVWWQDLTYPTAEAAFQAGKSLDPAQRARLAAAVTPGEAKRLGRTLTLRSGWDDHDRHVVMREVLAAKFTDPDLADRLVATGTALLVEGNTFF
jgi:predicted NAD-dependent protein-ADP-ribosyltransferase YbiA (DUF1768 family)